MAVFIRQTESWLMWDATDGEESPEFIKDLKGGQNWGEHLLEESLKTSPVPKSWKSICCHSDRQKCSQTRSCFKVVFTSASPTSFPRSLMSHLVFTSSETMALEFWALSETFRIITVNNSSECVTKVEPFLMRECDMLDAQIILKLLLLAGAHGWFGLFS